MCIRDRVNAIEHGEGRPIEIHLGVNAAAVAVAVRDHGVGLRPGEAGLVFNRFWRADPARARTTGGTGLGLSIAVEDARLHAGWLQAWGAPGEGSCFRLTLPRTPGAPIDSAPVPLTPAARSAESPLESAVQDVYKRQLLALLIAAVAFVVTRLVVTPVRQAAGVA